MMRYVKKGSIALLFILVDIVVLWGAFRFALLVRRLVLGPEVAFADISLMVRLGILFSVGSFFVQGLYPGYGLTGVKELERMVKGITFAFFLLASVFYLYKPFHNFPRSILVFAWLIVVVVLPPARFLLRNLLSRSSWYGLPVVVLGEQPWVSEVVGALKGMRRLGWRPVRVLSVEGFAEIEEGRCSAVMAIVALSAGALTGKFARALNQRFRRVVLLRPGAQLGSLWVEPRDVNGQLGLEFYYHLLDPKNRWFKRGVDMIGGGLLLLLLSPLLILLSLLVIVDSPGPLFFRQERLGLGFSRFRVIKFRTMLVDAEERLKRLLEEDEKARREYELYHKLRNDPRVTRMGRWLRKFSLDELPQLWNVIRGEMSLIGPRAYMPSELEDMGTYAEVILRVRPGMTGWWQVQGRHNTTFQKRLEMDEYYISNWSLWMDIFILLKTVWVVISGQGE